MSFISGLVRQSVRNAMLQPLWHNSPAADTPTRNGEKAADRSFIGGGAVAAAVGIAKTMSPGAGQTRLGWALVAGAGALAATAGWLNLNAAGLPTPPPPPPAPKPNPTDPGTGVKPPPGPGAPVARHTVAKGEYLSSIANCYELDWKDLFAYNRDVISHQDKLKPGMELRIPPADYRAPDLSYTPVYKPGHATHVPCPTGSPKAHSGDCAE